MWPVGTFGHAVDMKNSRFTQIATAGLLLGPVLFSLADIFRRLVEPADATSGMSVVHAVGQHQTLWLAAALLSLLASLCILPGVAGVVAVARGRGRRTTLTGAILLGIGAVACVGHAVAFYASYAIYSLAATPPAAVQAQDDASERYPLLIALVVLFMVGMMLGTLTMLVGLWRAHRVPFWAVIAALAFVVCGSTGGAGAGLVGLVATMAAFTPAALSIRGTWPSMRRAARPTPA